MRFFRKILLVIAIIICGAISYILGYLTGDSHSGVETLPTTLVMERTSPNGTVTAQILQGEKFDRWNVLGSNVRFHLALKYQNETCILSRDLSENTGTYEGGILDMKWLDNKRVLVHRTVADLTSYLVLDIQTLTWKDSLEVAA